jgi:hypothetical protein
MALSLALIMVFPGKLLPLPGKPPDSARKSVLARGMGEIFQYFGGFLGGFSGFFGVFGSEYFRVGGEVFVVFGGCFRCVASILQLVYLVWWLFYPYSNDIP